MNDMDARARFATVLCRRAGAKARAFFESRDKLAVDTKGAQDWVTQADRDIEFFIRDDLARKYPDDGVHGEEHDTTHGTSGFTWVIDPIDGTTNFINGIPLWTIVLAGVSGGQTQVGVIHDPNSDETFVAVRGRGATLNDAPIRVANDVGLDNGTVAVGYSGRAGTSGVLRVIEALVTRGAMFHRNASGALSLAYVSSGRLLGYLEEHMNAWDCLAGQLLVAEAGGRVEAQDADAMITDGGRVVAGTATVFDELKSIANAAWPG